MRISTDKLETDFNCPHCGMPLKVEDSEDFMDSHVEMSREEDYFAECPSCEHEFKFHVTWQPTYLYDPVEVDEC